MHSGIQMRNWSSNTNIAIVTVNKWVMDSKQLPWEQCCKRNSTIRHQLIFCCPMFDYLTFSCNSSNESAWHLRIVDHHSDQQWPLHRTYRNVAALWCFASCLESGVWCPCVCSTAACGQWHQTDMDQTKNGSAVSPVLNTVCRTWGHGHMRTGKETSWNSQWKVKLSSFCMSCHFPPPTIARVIFSFSDNLPLLQTGTGDGGADLCLVSAVPSRAAWHVTRDMTASHPPDTHTSHWWHLSPLGRVWFPSFSHVQWRTCFTSNYETLPEDLC